MQDSEAYLQESYSLRGSPVEQPNRLNGKLGLQPKRFSDIWVQEIEIPWKGAKEKVEEYDIADEKQGDIQMLNRMMLLEQMDGLERENR